MNILMFAFRALVAALVLFVAMTIGVILRVVWLLP